jgi:hypothetical protein
MQNIAYLASSPLDATTWIIYNFICSAYYNIHLYGGCRPFELYHISRSLRYYFPCMWCLFAPYLGLRYRIQEGTLSHQIRHDISAENRDGVPISTCTFKGHMQDATILLPSIKCVLRRRRSNPTCSSSRVYLGIRTYYVADIISHEAELIPLQHLGAKGDPPRPFAFFFSFCSE